MKLGSKAFWVVKNSSGDLWNSGTVINQDQQGILILFTTRTKVAGAVGSVLESDVLLIHPSFLFTSVQSLGEFPASKYFCPVENDNRMNYHVPIN